MRYFTFEVQTIEFLGDIPKTKNPYQIKIHVSLDILYCTTVHPPETECNVVQ